MDKFHQCLVFLWVVLLGWNLFAYLVLVNGSVIGFVVTCVFLLFSLCNSWSYSDRLFRQYMDLSERHIDLLKKKVGRGR